MNLFRFLGMAVITICMCTNFTACSEDGDGLEGGRDSSGKKKLVKIVYDYGDNDVYTYIFGYDKQGRLIDVKMEEYEGDGEFYYWNQQLIWENNTVKVWSDGSHRLTYTMANELMRSLHREYDQSYAKYYTYNFENKLVEISYVKGDEKSWSEYIWNEDKLIYGNHETYTYEDLNCKKGYLPWLYGDPIYMAHPELFGLKLTELPVSKEKEENGEKHYYTYQYEFNSNGYISKIIEIETVKDKNWSTTITLTWK
jgi:hypothetical protein